MVLAHTVQFGHPACPEANTYMLLRNRLSAQGDYESEEARADEEHDGKVEVVHPADECWACRGSHTAARAKGELRNKACQAHQQAPNQSPEGTLWRKWH